MESYNMIFKQDNGPLIFPQKTYLHEFEFHPETEKEYRLFFTGETESFYYWKTEYCSRALYKRISESLVKGSIGAWGVRFNAADYTRVLSHKILWKPKAAYVTLRDYSDVWQLGVSAKAENLIIKKDGYVRLVLEIRFRRDGLMINHTKNEPDRIYTIDFPEGSYDLRKFLINTDIPTEQTANINYIIEGENFEGNITFEEPFLISSNGFNIMPCFAPDTAVYQRYFNWLGVNLSRAEWPEMKISINGKTIFEGEFFERCHRFSEKEALIPENVLNDGKNTVEFTLTSDWHDALPYRLHEFGIVSEDAASFNIVSCPSIVTAGEEFSLLLDIKTPCRLTLRSKARAVSSLEFESAGLHFLRCICGSPENGVEITLTDGSHSESRTVERAVERGDDGVITGTGDLVYVNQDINDTRRYLKWYMQNNIGRLLTIRPVYRWSGSRKVHTDTWREMTRLFNGLGLKYPHMVDGREPQGFTANPPLSMLSAGTEYESGFLGRQLHERDGAYCYWGTYEKLDDFRDINNHYDTELIFDDMLRQHRLHPQTAGQDAHPHEMYDDGKRYWLCHDPSLPADMEIQAKDVIDSFREIKRDCTRHTGPSILFKYFCMAGYDWIGAETMDSPTEFLLCALRGAARAYGIKATGVHHALQWSSTPHDDPLRFQRYRLALYVSWMQGAHEINTEEGLWHMEENFYSHHRFSNAALGHIKMQQQFSQYVSAHERRGSFRAKIGVLHGRYDGYPCFGGDIVWGQSQSRFNAKFDAEQSWHIPKLSFFPTNNTSWSAVKHFSHGEPFPLVSGNPRGSFDIVPVEQPIGDYSLLAFFSYNKAEKQDLDGILRAVKNGSVLLLTLAHLTDSTNRADIENYELHFTDHEIFSLVGFDGVPEFTCNGDIPIADNITASEAEILEKTDGGLPLVVEKRVGRGKIVLFNTKLYPANPAIRELYTEYFEALSDKVNAKEHIMPIVGKDVQAAVYDLENGDSEVYFIAIDWWNTDDTPRRAGLRIGGHIYDISIPFGIMKKAYISGSEAIFTDSESSDIVKREGDEFVLTGTGKERFYLAENGKITVIDADFSQNAQQRIEF